MIRLRYQWVEQALSMSKYKINGTQSYKLQFYIIYFPKNIVKSKEVCYNMSVFDNIKIDTSFGDWIQVFDDESS